MMRGHIVENTVCRVLREGPLLVESNAEWDILETPLDEDERPGFKRSLSNVHLFGPRKSEKILVIQPVEYPDYTKIKSV